ncbi:Insecticidal toxin complex protein TccB3 [hydrothermal vent metagenome]|uniref:Insecticidal toxin complex protein TccB3 n=1 Tax=hydrothermal vent metagenome TaxID=652676 RepID=A0A1W1E4L8_9ZZZZ
MVIYLADKGFHSANHIATLPRQQFLELCQDFPDSVQLENAYKAAQAIRSACMHIMANAKNLHPSGGFSNTKAFTADPDIFTSFEDLPSYEMLFGSLDYYDCAEFSSIFGPAAYLLDLMRITQVYISDVKANNIPEGLHFFDRRPDIKKLLLTEENTTTEVLKLKIVNERIDNLLKTHFTDAKKDYINWLDQTVYPFNMPFCLPLTQIHSGLNQVELSLSTIYKTLQIEAKYWFRESLTLSPNQHYLVTTMTKELATQVKLWGEVGKENPFENFPMCSVFSKHAGLNAKDLANLFRQNLNIDVEIQNATNFYISKHLAKYASITKHYFEIDGFGEDAIIVNLLGDGFVALDNLDMLGRFIRFSEYIGLSFQDTDWLLNVAEFLLAGIAPYDSGIKGNGRIDALGDDKLDVVGKIYELADLLQQPVTEILNSLGIIKTYGIGSNAISEAPFDIIFNGATNDNPYHPTYKGNPDFYKDTAQEWDVSNKDIPLSVANILSQLGLGKADLLALGKYILKVLNLFDRPLALNVENLSLLYSYSSMTNWLNITVAEFVLINENLTEVQVHTNTWVNPVNRLTWLVNIVVWMKKYNTNAFKVDYIVNGNISRYVDLGFSVKDFPQWLKSTRALTPLVDGKVTSKTIIKLVNTVADFLNAPQEVMKALFDMNSTDWVLGFLTSDSPEDAQLPIVKFSRLLTLNKFLQINTPVLLSSINQYPESYGFEQFPANGTRVGIDLVQLQSLTAFKHLQNQFNDTENDFIRYIGEVTPFVPKFDKGVGYKITDTNTITNTAESDGWSKSIVFSSSIVKGGGVSLKMGQVNNQVIFGLAASLASMQYDIINYAISTNDGELFVMEQGKTKESTFGKYTTNDVLSVERQGDTVNYLKNNVLFYTSTTKSTKDMHLCVTFKNKDDFVTDVQQFTVNSYETNKLLHHITNWDIGQVRTISARYSQYRVHTAAFIVLVNNIFSLTSNLGNDVNMLFSFADKTVINDSSGKNTDMQEAEKLLLAQLKSCYTPSNFQVIEQTILGGVLEKKRDVTAVIATWVLEKTYPDILYLRNLSEFLLTDVNVSAKITTSYIKEAINAAQLYLQRVKLDIEQYISQIEIEEVWWQWISNYRVWEANREIYLYPENYLEPSLRKNQSKEFQDFSQTLLQNEITTESVQVAFKKYFQGFKQVADLHYLSSYYTETNDKQAVYYFFAVSKMHPPQYYYCTYTYPLNDNFDFQNKGVWSLWNKVGVNINNSKNITPIYCFGKLMLFWVEIKKVNYSNVSSSTDKNDANGTADVKTNNLDVYKATIKYSFLKEDSSWEVAQILTDEEVIYVDDKQSISQNKFETSDDSYLLFSGLFTNMDSDEWNTVYVNSMGDNIVLYYGPFVNKVVDSSIKAPQELYVESIDILEDFQMRLFDLLEKRIGVPSVDSHIPYINIRVFNQYLEQKEVKAGYCVSSTPLLSSFLNGDDKRFVLDNNTYNRSLYANLAGNIYNNFQFGDDSQNAKLTVLEFFALAESLAKNPIIINLTTFIQRATQRGYIEQANSSYYATIQYSLLANDNVKRDQISKIMDETGKTTVTDEVFKAADQLLMTGENNRALMLFADIDIEYSNQFAVKNKSGAFLYENKDNSLFLNLQAKQGKQSGIISPRLFYGASLLNRDSFVMNGIDQALSRKIFSTLANDGYIFSLSVSEGHIGFKSSFQLLIDSVSNFFVDTEKFVGDMRDQNWGDLISYFSNLGLMDVPAVYKVFNIMLAAPFVYNNFFIESLLDRKNMVDRKTVSTAIYKALKTDAKILIDGNDRLSYAIIADKGYQAFKKILLSKMKDTKFTERECKGIFDQIINCNPTIKIFNKSYQSMLIDVDFSLNNCKDMDYNIIRMGTVAFARLQKQLEVADISQVLSLENQQIPITEGGVITDLILPKGTILPDLLKDDQIDFVQGPYAQYYWELFFHAPILIAKNLSYQNKFEEAINWLKYIFNPSKKRKHLTPTTFSTQAPKQIDVTTSANALKTLQDTKLDDNPYVDNDGNVNKNYKGNEDLSFLKLNVVQTQIIRDILSNYHLINPINHYWNFQPFRNHTLQTIKQLLTNGNPAIHQYESDPFDPFAIAQLRIGAFEKYVLILYVDILIQWGDNLFTVDTRESINEATMLYLYAYDLLGVKPEDLGAKHQQKPTNFEGILAHYQGKASAIPEFLVDMENHFDFKNMPITKAINQPFNDFPSYFCIPENDQLMMRWNTVEDRLHKIHNSLDIEGNFQNLALFAPPINPLELIRATESGGNALHTGSHDGNTPIYRFASIVQLAKQCIDNVISLGRLLEGNLEKYSAEDLFLLHTTQESVMLNLVSNLKQDSIEQEQNVLNGLNSNLKSAQDRKQYYDDLIKVDISSYEKSAQDSISDSSVLNITSGVVSAAASAAFGIPQAGSPFAMTYGGIQVGGVLSATAQGLSTASNAYSVDAQEALTSGGYDRRKQEWIFSSAQAEDQMQEIDNQILASKVRIKTAQQDLNNHEVQIQQNQANADYLHNKFSNKALYQWLSGRVSALYHQQYQLALETAVLAQKAYQFELNSEQVFIDIIYWDSAHRGLLAGESLLSSLMTMEQSYKTYLSDRKLEIEKTISLSEFAPQALTNFRNDGACNFTLTEKLFSHDFPGHYQRQIKSISISIPAIIGPYQNLHATLMQSNNSIVLTPDINAVKYLLNQQGGKDDNIRSDWRSNQQIAISKGIEDAGVFQLDFKDELYLPFENTGAVSSWSLSMPKDNNNIDYDSISDVIIHLRYTAIAGDSDFAKSVNTALGDSATYPTALYHDLSRSFLSNWEAFMQDHSSADQQQLKFDFNIKTLQYFNVVKLDKVIFRMITSDDIQIGAIKTKVLSLSIGKKPPVNVDMTGEISKGDAKGVIIKDWCEIKDEFTGSKVSGVGWATELKLEKNANTDTINGSWVLLFDLKAIQDSDLKGILKDGFINPDKLLKIEMMSLCCAQPTK